MAGDEREAYRLPAQLPEPADNRATRNRTELGKMLFFDPRLSGSNWMSCASCHNPALGWSDGLPKAKGEAMKQLRRSTPTLVNSALNTIEMWDGRYRDLEEQVWGPILSENEMNAEQEATLEKLRKIKGYRKEFGKAYPGEGITTETVSKALASFERTIRSRDSAFDRWVDGDEGALSPEAKKGFRLFIGKANCAACHQGANFTDQGFHNIGLRGEPDNGRFERVPIRITRGAFKTPTLRDIALTAPYMHNGTYTTLEEVVDHYDRGGDTKENLDPNMKALQLSNNEKECLAEFLRSLTGKHEAVSVPRLPH